MTLDSLIPLLVCMWQMMQAGTVTLNVISTVLYLHIYITLSKIKYDIMIMTVVVVTKKLVMHSQSGKSKV